VDVIRVAAHARERDERPLASIDGCVACVREVVNSGMDGSEFILGITSSVYEADFGRAQFCETSRIEVCDSRGPDESASGSEVGDADAGACAAGTRPFGTKMAGRRAR
jgi:hypothetical protein